MSKVTVVLTGNLGQDWKTVGQNFVASSIAVKYTGSKNINNEYSTDWYNISVSGEELVQRLSRFKKGDNVLITGHQTFREYRSKGAGPNDPVIRSPQISVLSMEYASSGNGNGDGNGGSGNGSNRNRSNKNLPQNPLSAPSATTPVKPVTPDMDDIPF